MPTFLQHGDPFPEPERFPYLGSADGPLAVGGDLSIDSLLAAYRRGLFPWTTDPVTWWSPDPRAVFELESFRCPRDLARLIRRREFFVTSDRVFRRVIEGCAGQWRPGHWITPEFIAAYTAFHDAGHAHSIEVWKGETLAGGLYGVALNGFFAGESMFHTVSNASKYAVAVLIAHLKSRGFELFDIQMVTPVTRRLGATLITRCEYLRRLRAALQAPATFGQIQSAVEDPQPPAR